VEVNTYTANVTLDGRFWLIRVPEIDRVTQARTVDEIELMARDLVAIMENIPEDSFDLTVNVSLPASVASHLQSAASLRDESAETARRASEETRAAARELAATLPLREVGKVLKVSHQRVHQLVNS
jgi:hypothetical protein